MLFLAEQLNLTSGVIPLRPQQQRQCRYNLRRALIA
jgi:hypothetical protein